MKASVVIRSMNRLPHVARLVAHLLGQDYPDFEIVIVDQSSAADEDISRSLADHPDVRVRFFHSEPLGLSGAANTGLRLAQGEVVLFIDDDDWPVGESWISNHMKNYSDPRCVGVNGFMHYPERNRSCPAKSEAEERRRWRLMLSHGFFKQPNGYAYSRWRKEGIDYLMGGNASVRRSRALELGGWDQYVEHHPEHSLFLKFARHARPGEYLVYDPLPEYQVRTDIGGGMERRSALSLRWRVEQVALYFTLVVGRYFPFRIFGLFPIFFCYFIYRAGNEAWWHAKDAGRSPTCARLFGMAYAPAGLVKAAWYRK